jgi:RNA polymerase sigma factor (sigma-70 family)
MSRGEAFRILFSKGMVVVVMRWLGRLGVALRDRGDVAQDVLLAAFRSFPTYDPTRSRPERWLNGITVHVAVQYFERKKHQRDEPGADPLGDLVDESPALDHRIIAAQEYDELYESMQFVDLELRALLIAHYFDEIPMNEFTESMQMSLSTAYKSRARGLRQLKSAILEHRAAARFE